MIDFILGLIGGAILGGLAVYHFKGESPAKITSDLQTLERIKTMLSDAFNQAITRLEQSVDAKIAAADTGAEVDAEATAAVTALADKFTPPPTE